MIIRPTTTASSTTSFAATSATSTRPWAAGRPDELHVSNISTGPATGTGSAAGLRHPRARRSGRFGEWAGAMPIALDGTGATMHRVTGHWSAAFTWRSTAPPRICGSTARTWCDAGGRRSRSRGSDWPTPAASARPEVARRQGSWLGRCSASSRWRCPLSRWAPRLATAWRFRSSSRIGPGISSSNSHRMRLSSSTSRHAISRLATGGSESPNGQDGPRLNGPGFTVDGFTREGRLMNRSAGQWFGRQVTVDG